MRLSAPLFRLKRLARQLARKERLPHHAALDMVAADEGFSSWGLLAAYYKTRQNKIGKPEASVLAGFGDGELLILAARPGHGKTLFGIDLLVEAARSGHQAFFFSCECSLEDVNQRLSHSAGRDPKVNSRLLIDLSDRLCADHIETGLSMAEPGTVAVIDYLQVLDQRRSEPELDVQIRQLRRLALRKGIRLVFLSQVHRSFDPDKKQLPGFADLRLPNPVAFQQGLFPARW
ncbi:MAG: DNA helicase [Roseibium sp.]|uniref:DNA helicase n=1 Tax=Roseibium sp. TaxID=1936156 RepID=UPI0026230C70|nr:DNA helicase [Roseibium sp.]MCV0427503.1 DNA helicase [Roseibium sp.]